MECKGGGDYPTVTHRPAFRLLTAYPPADALPHDGNDVTGDDADEKLAVGIPLPAGLLSQEDLPILKEAE
ncbi:hypothetical protein LTR29_006021 [Friedmanniomyces endolithicus]|nr:hypothetical protein LTR29_006021 [Friedmanniomyces endolithicus]